jgi:L-fuconolactonase
MQYKSRVQTEALEDKHMNRNEWRDQVKEEAIEPSLPIVDAHHHVWRDAALDPYEHWDAEWLYRDKAGSGHNIVATIFVDSHTAYRTDGPETMRVLGETEYAESVANESERRGGAIAGACAVMACNADLLLGAAVGEVLDAHAAITQRFRGIRHMTAWTPELQLLPHVDRELMDQPEFRSGFAELAKRNLTFDAFLLQPQLPQLTALARAFPDTQIILDHLGTPMVAGRYAGDRAASFADWKRDMSAVAACPNVALKLGGLNMGMAGVDALERQTPFTSDEMAQAQRDYILTGIDLFGANRCMFESNFPVDMRGISYGVLWNSFKKITADFSKDDRTMLFSQTAQEIYRFKV